MRDIGFIQPQAICRHSPGDHDCSKYGNYYYKSYEAPKTSYEAPKTPDKANYHIEDVLEVGKHLVMKVSYPNCSSCAYEGRKIMVFLNTNPVQALRWKEIDPHFSDPKVTRSHTQAPSPSARFPASDEGWADAIAYARCKTL